MRKARKWFKKHYVELDGNPLVSFRSWARFMVSNRSISFEHLPPGKLERITRCAKP
jgi:hypothetical protein